MSCLSLHSDQELHGAGHVPPKSLRLPSTNPVHRGLTKDTHSGILLFHCTKKYPFLFSKGSLASMKSAPGCKWVLFKDLVRRRVRMCSRCPARADTNSVRRPRPKLYRVALLRMTLTHDRKLRACFLWPKGPGAASPLQSVLPLSMIRVAANPS